MKFSFTSMGSSSALPTMDKYPSAHVLNIHERLFLIDCGEGCQMQMRRYGISILKIDHIFISHLHGDHIFGLPGLLSTMSMLGRSAPLFIYAPKPFKAILKSFLSHFGESFKYDIVHIIINAQDSAIIFNAKSIEVAAFPLDHRIECYGFIFREKEPAYNIYKEKVELHNLSLYEIARLKENCTIIRDSGEVLSASEFTYKPFIPRSFAYCSDSAPFEMLKNIISGTDLLYHEATFLSDLADMAKETMHSTAKDAAGVALVSGVKKLLIGHFSSRYKDVSLFLEEARQVFKEIYIAKQGMEFDIPLEKTNLKI